MKIQNQNKLLILLLTSIFAFSLSFSADALTGQTLQKDLNYYRKVSKQKKLNSNDRKYILNRIKDKYEGFSVNLKPLEIELEKAGNAGSAKNEPPAEENNDKTEDESGEQSSITFDEGESPVTSPAPKIKTAAKKSSPGSKTRSSEGKVEKIFVSETNTESKIIIASSGVKRSNYFLMKDPSGSRPPKIVLDLYGVDDKLKPAARDISPVKGLFLNVSAGQFEGPPNNVVRVIAELRKDAPYKVRKERDLIIITVEKSGQEEGTGEADAAMPAVSVPVPQGDISAGGINSEVEGASSPLPVKSDSAPTVDLVPPDKTVKNTNSDYKIENADILGITIYPAEELSREAVVQPDGNISFPLIGATRASGLTIKQLENSLSQELSRFISTPQVTITVKQFSRRQIFITGEVKGVGAYNFKENLRLMEFISSIGGFTESANRKDVKIYRGPPTKRQIHVVNVEEIVKSGDFSKDFLLESGDIIEVQKGAAKIAILGDIRSPGYYDYKDNMRLIELVSLAGGFTDSASIKDVSIIHEGSVGKQNVVIVNLKKILDGVQKDVILQSGDTVYVPKGKFASANWFVSNILPWLSLISIVLVLRAGI